MAKRRGSTGLSNTPSSVRPLSSRLIGALDWWIGKVALSNYPLQETGVQIPNPKPPIRGKKWFKSPNQNPPVRGKLNQSLALGPTAFKSPDPSWAFLAVCSSQRPAMRQKELVGFAGMQSKTLHWLGWLGWVAWVGLVELGWLGWVGMAGLGGKGG